MYITIPVKLPRIIDGKELADIVERAARDLPNHQVKVKQKIAYVPGTDGPVWEKKSISVYKKKIGFLAPPFIPWKGEWYSLDINLCATDEYRHIDIKAYIAESEVLYFFDPSFEKDIQPVLNQHVRNIHQGFKEKEIVLI